MLQYYSTVDLVPHQYSGLVGVVAIGRMGTFAADGAQHGLPTLPCHKTLAQFDIGLYKPPCSDSCAVHA